MAEWSDGRLDEFAQRVDERFDRAEEKAAEGFDGVDVRFDRAEQRVGDRFAEVDRRFDEANRRFDVIDRRLDREFARVNDRLDDLVKVMIAGIITFTGAVLAGFAALVVLFVTQV